MFVLSILPLSRSQIMTCLALVLEAAVELDVAVAAYSYVQAHFI